MDKTEEANSFYSTVVWLVENKEHRHHQYKWSQQEIEHIKLGLSLMRESQRKEFRERFKSYQIIKALDEDISANESRPAGSPEQ